ncbi:MAG TPA: VCBS repeat-containing protein [Terriglobales bacterium]|nr:VCBS repeat-containing protein [Terriglobales bacterium]
MLFRDPRRLLPVFLLAGLSSAALAQLATTTVTFSAKNLTTGPSPSAVVSGDFNEDGRPDLAVIDIQSNSVQVIRNDGGGQFSLASQTNTGMDPVQIVTGKFNFSDHQDLAVANAGDRTVTILLGRGDGTFSRQSFRLSGVPAAMIAASLLKNGLTQLAVVECAKAHVAPCSLNLYQSNFQALFSRSQSIPLLGGAPIFNGLIASDDFNIDGKPDIAIATVNRVLIYANTSFNGQAKLALRSSITPPNTATIDGLASGHFNAGSAPDLAIEVFDNANDTNFPNSDYVFLNTGSGLFFLKEKVPGSSGFGHTLTVSDINGDGKQDLLLLGTSVHNGDLRYALGRGDGTFATPKPVSAFSGGINTSIIARDLNLDSRHDLALSSRGPLGGTAFAEILLNQNAATNCQPPRSTVLTVRFCSASTATNLISVKASGNSRNGVKRVELWIDGRKRAQAFDDQLRATVPVAAGSHRVTAIAVDLYDSLAKKTLTVSVP